MGWGFCYAGILKASKSSAKNPPSTSNLLISPPLVSPKIVSPKQVLRFPALPRSFYDRPTVDVARDLLGNILVCGDSAGRIVETEAYLGSEDPAAHSYKGRTTRTRVIFGPAGHAYVYLIYGMYHCMNVVVGPEGSAGCVLIRAVEPVTNLAASGRGPGRLTRALGITLDHYGADLTKGIITIRKPADGSPFETSISPRIGIREAVDWPLRFFITGNTHVSRGK